MKRVIILGASGIIGQMMRLVAPPHGVIPIWVRYHADLLHYGVDLNDRDKTIAFLQTQRPLHAVVNLAGMSDTDAVEHSPAQHYHINVEMPDQVREWCDRNNVHFVQVSSQAVFSGTNPPYSAMSPLNPVNEYGKQKAEAEQRIRQRSSNWTIVRPTFVLGVRPLPNTGRKNPIEQMLEGQRRQVIDRYFSPSDALEVARELWNIALGEPQMTVINIGMPIRTSRYEIASMVSDSVEPAMHDEFVGIAQRPLDTTYCGNATADDLYALVTRCRSEYNDRQAVGKVESGHLHRRAIEISLFTGAPATDCMKVLNRGFSEVHNEVTADFWRFNPQDDDQLLDWYRRTEAYIWELSVYHADVGFNYAGMCHNVVDRLRDERIKTALILGDGIGDMTLALLNSGVDAYYHDLYGSRTAAFAEMRLQMYAKSHESLMSAGWNPPTVSHESFDAICAADFLEHVTDVPKWVKFIYQTLKPGGLLFAQNAFGIGSGDHGPMPMHLSRNDQFEKDWDPMMESLGFKKLSDNWYKKPGKLAKAPEPYASVETV